MCCKERKLYCKVRIIVNLRKIHESKITRFFREMRTLSVSPFDHEKSMAAANRSSSRPAAAGGKLVNCHPRHQQPTRNEPEVQAAPPRRDVTNPRHKK
jgi:hypothetical protein